MKEYMRQLRWFLWAAVLLPLTQAACTLRPSLMLLRFSIVGFVLYPAALACLFLFAGRRMAEARYSVARACFAGPILILVSNILIGIPVKYATFGPYLLAGGKEADRQWLGWLTLPITAILLFLVAFPFALGLAALGAQLYRKRQIFRTRHV